MGMQVVETYDPGNDSMTICWRAISADHTAPSRDPMHARNGSMQVAVRPVQPAYR
jgi:hypothetical protein